MLRSIVSVCALLFAIHATAATPPATLPKSGEAAPDFTLPGADGKTYKLSQFKGKTVVLEWFNNDCPYVKKFYDTKTMQGWQKAETGKGTVWLSIISSAPGKEGHVDAKGAMKIVADRGMASTAVLLDNDGKVGKTFGAKTTPHMYVIDKAGKLVYQGAIDDRPTATTKSLEGAQNYVLAALTAIEKGEPVKNASTTPYGCSVKY